MGYFALQTVATKEEFLKAALKNIELWEDMEKGGEYLISGFVKHQIEEALELMQKEKENES